MMQRMKGTLRPGRKAGVLALAVLLLTCVLMAGAVSATGEIEFNESSFDDSTNTFTIRSGGIYVLNDTATGNITINAADGGDVTLKAEDDATLNGGIQIKGVQNVTIEGMHINSTLISGSGSSARNLAIILPSSSIKLCLKNNTIDFAASDAPKGSSVISTTTPLSDESEIIDNTISGVTAHVLNTAGVADGGTLIVQGNTVTMDPDEDIGSNNEKQGTGRALLKLFHNPKPALNLGVTYIVTDNVVKLLSDDSRDATVVRVDETTPNPNKITVTMYNNTYKGDSASPYLYGGSIYGHNLGGLNITVSDADGPRILVPGLNQTGVKWTGDDGSGYTLSITAPGSYKLMDDVTISSMTVSAENAVIDGNKDTCTLTLLGTEAQQGVIIVDNDATLQNLNVVAKDGAAFGTAIKVNSGSLTGSTIDLTNQNAESSSATGRMSAIAVYVENGKISDNTILAGNSKTSSSQCVVVSGSGVTVSGNTLTTGKSVQGTSGSVGIRLSSGASGTTTITNNHITSTQGAGLNNGIAADGVSGNVAIDASGNTFALAATEYDGGAFYVNPTDGTTVTINAKENTVESAASFIYADNAEKATAYTISGKIENNDFAAADKGLVSADGLTLTLDDDFHQSGNSGLITDPSESLIVNAGESKITVTGAEVSWDGKNAIIAFTGYEIFITNATLGGSNIIIYDDDSTATVTHNTVRHMDSSTNIRVKLLITDMPKLAEISTPKATIGDAEKARLAAQKITPLSVVDIHHESEPGFDQITLTISGLRSSGEIIGFHVGESGVDTSEVTTQDGNHVVTFTDLTSASPFGIGVISDEPTPQPTYSSGSGNMENAYRVLFNDGSTTLSVVTDLSSGDKLTKPETPVKDGYTFAGWYKDSACTQAWDFETGIPGDMTLYAKWTAAGSSGETEATATPTATAVTTPQPTKTQTAAATTSAPQATTAAGVSPTLTQAPAPVAGALFGLLAAGVLLRRRFQ